MSRHGNYTSGFYDLRNTMLELSASAPYQTRAERRKKPKRPHNNRKQTKGRTR